MQRPHDFHASNAKAYARQCVDEAITSFLAHRGNVGGWLREALRHDPDCVAAHCVRACASLLAADHPHMADTRALAALDRLQDRATDRERRHLAALRTWRDRGALFAADHFGRLLDDDPLDSISLAVAHALDFRLGRRELLRDRVAPVLPHWDAHMPHFGYVLAMYAFGLEENGELDRAEETARRALELVPDNAAAIHVIAHVFEMRGRSNEGIAWLEATRAIWRANAGFAVHIAWHLALFHVDRDDPGAALATYDALVRPATYASTSALVDASALLWRLALRGVDVKARFNEIAKRWRHKRLRGMRAFNLVHATIAFVASRRWRRVRGVIALLRRDATTRAANQPEDLDLAVPVCESLYAFGRRDYRRAVDRLTQVRAAAERCGGSVAQCDVIVLTLLEAALRSRRDRLADVLLSERNARKPRSPLNRWFFARAEASR